MGFFKKISNTLRENLNSWLDEAENPQKLADLEILESRSSLEKAKKLLIKHENTLKILESHKDPDLNKQIKKHQESIIIIKQGIEALEEYINKLNTNFNKPEKLELSTLEQELEELKKKLKP